MVKKKNKNVLHIANYGAIYRGNFIESLDALNRKLEPIGIDMYYMLPKNADKLSWVIDLMQEGRNIDFMTDDALRDAAKIKAIIMENNIGIVHTHFISMKQYLEVYFGCLGTKAKIVMHFHNHSREAFGIKNFLRKRLYRKCTMVACSKSVYDSIVRDYPNNKKYCIDNGVFFERLNDVNPIDGKDYSIAEESKVCLIFGFDFYRKGVDLALKAIDGLNREHEEKIELLISLSRNFETVEKETEKILGKIPDWVHVIKARNDIASLYELSDVFLSPSREEGLPYSVIEAAYCTCNVVASDISAQANLTIPYGEWHVTGDDRSLQDAILRALASCNDKKNDMGNVRKQIESRYNLDDWVDNIMSVYSDVPGE